MIYILFWTTKIRGTFQATTFKFKENQGLQLKKIHRLLVKARLPSLLKQRVQEIIMYKVTYNLCPSYISDILKLI